MRPFELLGGALNLLVRKRDVGVVRALLLRIVALLVLLEPHLRERHVHLALQQVRVAVALGDLQLLLRDDEVAFGGGDGDLLLVPLVDERG